MLTAERLDALNAVKDGTVTASAKAAPGSPVVFKPREMTVAIGFLMKADLVSVETVRVLVDRTKVPRCTVQLTKRGEQLVSRLQA